MKEKYDNIDEYIKDLKAAIADTDGRCASHHYNLGLALLSKRDFVGAESEFREALRESVHMAEAMVQLGGICLQRGDLEGCLRYNEEASSCRPKVAIAESNIIKTLQTAFGVEDLSKADLQKGAKDYMKAIGLTDAEITSLMTNLGYKAPATGDAGVVLYMGLAILALTGGVFVARKKELF